LVDRIGLVAADWRNRLTLRTAKLHQLCVCILVWTASANVIGADEHLLLQADGSVFNFAGTATRIITLSPHLAEIVYAAGAGDQLVATVEYSNYPEAANDIPRIGDAFRIDIERIIALRPDLVIAWDSGNPQAAVTQLRSLGLAVWSVEIDEPEEIADVLESLGQLTEQAEPSRSASMEIRQRLNTLSRQYAGVEALQYFYQIGNRPLFTINGNHLISKGLERCGGRNIFSHESGLAFQVSYESVIVADPDALFAPWQEDAPNPLDAWQDWPSMKAVRQQALFLLPADPVSRATPRFLDSLEMACKLLHQLRGRNAE
jgi:iron complex transport system substrate-binding protein